MENDYRTYGRIRAAYRNLDRYRKRGQFDKDKAVKLMEHVAAEGAKEYYKQYGACDQCRWNAPTWYDMFPVPVRRMVARALVNEYNEYIDEGDEWWTQ